MADGFEIYRGPSEIDGAPIVVIATGVKSGRSRNAKTGNLIQTWIMRADMQPTDAIHNGADESICGTCPHRGEIVPDGEGGTRNKGRSCYVKTFQAPLNVWRTWKAGKYPLCGDNAAGEVFAGLRVRVGSYGDPAAVPFRVWERITGGERGTGYTHRWRDADPRLASICMASADSLDEAREAQAQGWRTFRVGSKAESLVKGEFLCPASEEAGKVTDCAACRACSGLSAPNRASVFIPVHGAPGTVNAFDKWKGA